MSPSSLNCYQVSRYDESVIALHYSLRKGFAGG